MFEEVKFTRMAAVELHHVLQTTNFDDPIGNRFRYMVTTNLEVLKKEIDEINKAFPEPKKLPEYKTKRNEIYKKYNIEDDKAYAAMPVDTKKILDDEIVKEKLVVPGEDDTMIIRTRRGRRSGRMIMKNK